MLVRRKRKGRAIRTNKRRHSKYDGRNLPFSSQAERETFSLPIQIDDRALMEGFFFAWLE